RSTGPVFPGRVTGVLTGSPTRGARRYSCENGGMPRLRIALAQVNPTVGDIAGNAGIVRAVTRRAVDAGAHLVAFPEMMLTGYPVELDKGDVPVAAGARRAAEAGATVAYVNMVGGQDELVFDGDSMIVAADGALIARSPQFDEDLMVVDLDLPGASSSAPSD